MRPVLILVCLLGGAALALGQGGPLAKVPAEPPADPKLEEALQGWEKTMGSVQGMVADLNRTRLDKAFGSTEVFEGKVKFLRAPDPRLASQASLDLTMKGKPGIFEKFIFTGAFLYEFRASTKAIVVHTLPPPKPGTVTDDNILGFVFGMKADDVKKRYFLTFLPPPPKNGWYHYIKIQPRFEADKAEFSEARLVLIRSSSLPRQFWFRQPNGDEITWDFPKIDLKAAVGPLDFAPPAPPAGWKLERAPAMEPRVLRHSGKE